MEVCLTSNFTKGQDFNFSIKWVPYRDRCEASSGESNSNVVVSNVTDLEMTPVNNDNSCSPAKVNKLLKRDKTSYYCLYKVGYGWISRCP